MILLNYKTNYIKYWKYVSSPKKFHDWFEVIKSEQEKMTNQDKT